MTYLPTDIMKNVLDYCNDRIEVKQKKLKTKLLANLSLLQEDLISKRFYDILEDNNFGILTMDDYINEEEVRSKISDLLWETTYIENFYEGHYDIDLTDKFIEELIY